MFALVGIAGEDDLDAPDLNICRAGPTTTQTSATASVGAASMPHAANGSAGTDINAGRPRPQSDRSWPLRTQPGYRQGNAGRD